MHKPRRASVALFFTFFLLLGSLQWAAPIAAQTDPPTDTTEATVAPSEQPTEVPPTEVVVPTETTAPEPTATTVPTEIVAPSVTPTAPVEPTATTADSEFEAAAPIYGFYAYLMQCEDSSRLNVTDFFYFGEFGAAAGEIGVNCVRVPEFISGAAVQVTLNSDTQSYSMLLDSSGQAYFGSEVEAGTYQVALLAGEEYTAVMQGTVTLEPYSNSELAVVRYVEGGLSGPTEPGATTVQGQFIYCLDPSRVGQVDLLFQGTSVNNNLDAAAEASECVQPNSNQGQIQLTGDDFDGRPYQSEIVSEGNFYFSEVPYGSNFRFTDLTTGGTSSDFPIGGVNGTNLYVTVYAYYAEEAPLLPVVDVQKLWCKDDDRAGGSEFVIVNDSDFGASAESTCIGGFLSTDNGVTMTLATFPGGEIAGEVTTYGFGPFDSQSFETIEPGTYTLTETYAVGEVLTTATSDPFTLAYGDYTQIQVINYIEEDGFDGPEEGETYLSGGLLFCESEERAGLVDFLIGEESRPESKLTAQGTSTCRYAEFDEGLVTLNYYGVGSSIPTEVVDTFTGYRNSEGGVNFGYIPSGFYQLVFADSSFPDGVYESEIFPLQEYTQHAFEILAYIDAVPSSELRVEKHFCYDPERENETDFYVNQIPESDDQPVPVSASADLNCHFANFDDLETLEFTLTDTATNAVITAQWAGYPNYGFIFPAVPAGTYILTETWGDNVASSEEITVDPADEYPYVFVYNYTADPIDPQEGDPYVELNAFSCDTGSRGGEFDYFFYPEIPRGGEPTLTGAATENCRGANLGEFSFELETFGEGGEVAATAVYPLTQDPDFPLVFYYVDGAEDVIPAGTYVVRGTVNGSTTELVSAPFAFGGFDNLVEFYFFQAAPTPTPTDVPGQPTATPTDVPGQPTATPTDVPVDPTSTTVPGEPTATTAPGEPTATSDGNVDPGGDDDPDGDEDGDGTPNSEDPDFPGGVNQLPSTGQGSNQGTSSALLILLALAAALLLAGAIRTGRHNGRPMA